jgi:hypothetical protein
MEKENKIVTRKRFIAWSVGISSLLAVPAFLRFPNKKKKQATTVKMLTQDANIPSQKKKIKTADIHRWINRNTSL